jgi:hypothetical protein
VPAPGDVVQQPSHHLPVVNPFLFYYFIIPHVAVFELDRIRAVAIGRRLEDDARLRLDVGDPALERDGMKRLLSVRGDRETQDKQES